MRKISFIILAVIGTLILNSSCNKTKTYADYLKDESKAIKNFIAENNIKVLDEYPADSTFAPNEFYRDPATGVYFNVIDRGGRRASIGEEVYVRFSGLEYFMKTDTTKYSNMTSVDTQILVFGNSATYPAVAWVVPLAYVGHLGEVKMIVPFNSGLPEDKAPNYQPTYYNFIKYRIEEPYSSTN